MLDDAFYGLNNGVQLARHLKKYPQSPETQAVIEAGVVAVGGAVRKAIFHVDPKTSDSMSVQEKLTEICAKHFPNIDPLDIVVGYLPEQ